MTYKDELIRAMNLLSQNDKVIFLGQEIISNNFYNTLNNISREKMIELPIMEDAQMGMSIGLSLMNFIPVSLYTRMDFFLLAMNQLINHLDKIEEMSKGEYKPKVIIRIVIGEHFPLECGPQHTQDFTDMLKCVLKNIEIVKLNNKSEILPAYENALNIQKSSILIERKELYNE